VKTSLSVKSSPEDLTEASKPILSALAVEASSVSVIFAGLKHESKHWTWGAVPES
jgi:hypothetical protein